MRVLSPRMDPPLRELVGIDREHRDPVAPLGQVHAELIDEGALADPRHPGDADASRPAGVREQLLEDPLGPPSMLQVGALDQRDRSGEDGPVTRQHPVDVRGDRCVVVFVQDRGSKDISGGRPSWPMPRPHADVTPRVTDWRASWQATARHSHPLPVATAVHRQPSDRTSHPWGDQPETTDDATTSTSVPSIVADAGTASADDAGLALAHVRLAEVAERAGVTKGALYHIWPSQEAFWHDLLEHLMAEQRLAGIERVKEIIAEIEAFPDDHPLDLPGVPQRHLRVLPRRPVVLHPDQPVRLPQRRVDARGPRPAVPRVLLRCPRVRRARARR